ncbi:uncharacterized protein F4812DRAFT_465860 [Daldinia caldariorum]|uniref:uncharacterized protein n=1 Tax=Daldinia caldariorum TaxID=326644 RepID=UPI0020085353|nr:uncharacterized protein F4812DRAFT_465860 [Daldinia caldariorum]KAI1465953.1 hypothetical protein F4812DRAFT_465860 [Daldinia caldariorum]
MKPVVFRILFLAAAAALAGADDNDDATATSTTACAAQNILDTCLFTTESYVSLCETTDYICLCDKYIAIMTCFYNCPNDPRESSYQQTKDLYCTDASLYGTATANRTISIEDVSATSSAEATTTGEGVKSADFTSATSTASPTRSGNGAGEMVIHAGGKLAALVGVAAYFL